MKKKIGFFGGTFDPIHFGHIHLALSILEALHLDQVIFMPTWVSPFKTNAKAWATPMQRLDMVKLAVEDYEKFICLDYEIAKQEISYTFDTIEHLKKTDYQGSEFRLILGKDMVKDFSKWKNHQELISLAKPIVGVRYCKDVDTSIDFEEISLPVIDISATRIRQRLKQKLNCNHLMPAKVLDYIYKHQLYSTEN